MIYADTPWWEVSIENYPRRRLLVGCSKLDGLKRKSLPRAKI